MANVLDQIEIEKVNIKEHVSNGSSVFVCFHMYGCLSSEIALTSTESDLNHGHSW